MEHKAAVNDNKAVGNPGHINCITGLCPKIQVEAMVLEARHPQILGPSEVLLKEAILIAEISPHAIGTDRY